MVSSITITNLQAQVSKCLSKDKTAKFMLGRWEGKFKQYTCGLNEEYPMIIEIYAVKGKTFKGYFIWDDGKYMDGRTVLEGEIKGNKVFLYEGKLLEGAEGNLVLDGVYESKLTNCNQLDGFWKLNSPQDICPDPKSLINGGKYTIYKNTKHKVNPPIAERKVKIKQKVIIKSKKITIRIWDHQQEDGDIVSLRLNGKYVLQKKELSRKPYIIELALEKESNILTLDAINLGSIPPNTAAIEILSEGKQLKRIVLESDMNTSEAIDINTE
jgi:hypothetical protein